ncbi:MAG: L,D-transpeptidase, partial [Deltaproteobacteria bacterium]|nr:L,D-transpeptidase [Deltaproteobacteria bacterium]
DLEHPTLTAMALGAARGAPLPYPYARAVRDTELLAVDPEDPGRVVAAGMLRAESGLAVVGSWTARGPAGDPLDLALGLDGRFVATRDLTQVEAPEAPAVTLGGGARLPLGIVTRRGAARLALERTELVDRGRLPMHSTVALSGEVRRVGRTELLATRDGEFVRARDVARVEAPASLPTWAEGGVRWLDVDLTARVVLAFEGALPVRAALISTGAPAPGSAGELRVTAKAIARLGAASALRVEGHEVRDAPWTLDLSDGRRLVGAYWHGRFGSESRSGALELAPADARFLFDFVGPELPAGWHGVVTAEADDRRARVRVR